MSRNRQFYCHRCSSNVQIDVGEWKCRDCSSGFVEELTTPERNNDGMSFSISHRIGPGSLRSIIPQLTGGQSGSGGPFGMVRLSMSGSPSGSRPHIQIGNQSTVGSRPDRPHIVIDPTEGMPEEQRHGIQHMIQNILLFGGVNFGGGAAGGSFNPADFAWGPNGLDDIITQLLQQVEGGAPPTPQSTINQLQPEVYTTELQKRVTECSVCLSDFELSTEVIQLPGCQHIFHPECIRNWLNLHNSCPICRTGISESNNRSSVQCQHNQTDRISPPSLD